MVLGAMERCGCTTATYPQKEIAPGDTSCINVNFDPVNRNGGFKQRVTILLSGPSRCNTLFIKGRIISDKKTED